MYFQMKFGDVTYNFSSRSVLKKKKKLTSKK